MRQANQETRTQSYTITPREVAEALDIEHFDDSSVSASVSGGYIKITVRTDRNSATPVTAGQENNDGDS